MEWVKKSARLQVAEVDGREFRIERTGNAHIGSGCVTVREVNASNRDLQRQTANGLREARKIAKEMLARPVPEEPLPLKMTRVGDLTLGLGRGA